MKQFKMKPKQKTLKKLRIPISITWPKKGESIKPTINTTNVLISGILITCIALSLVSGFIDLVFFSGLSKSLYTVFAFQMTASILFSIMSLGFTSAKFFCSMQLGAINELQNRLKNEGYSWYKNLNKLKLKWHVAHKFLICVSLITSISLSVVSIGDGIRKNQNVIKRANDDIQKISKYLNTTDTSDDVQFQALVSGTNASSTAGTKAADIASKIWPVIEEYRINRAEFESTFGSNSFSSKEEVEWKGDKIIPDTYWDNENSKVQSKVKSLGKTLTLNQIRNISSEAYLATMIKEEIEKSVANNSLEGLTELADKTKAKAVQEVRNLEGKYYMPGSKEPVVFDENNISGAITILGDIKAAYENDTGDIGETSKLFMLVGPSIDNLFNKKATNIEDAFNQDVKVSSFGTTELMMMILIMVFGIVQEFLIALFTPKSTINRKMLSRFDSYFGHDFDIDMFLLKTYKDYLKKGIINQKEFETKAKKAVELMEDSVDDVILRYSKKARSSQKKDDDLKELKAYYEKKLEEERELTKYLRNIEEAKKGNININNIESALPSVETVKTIKQDVRPASVERKISSNQDEKNDSKPQGFSSAVDDLVNEIEGIE